MTTSLEIRLLGPFEALVDGRRAEVTGPKRPALLALLALDGGRVVPVEVLVDALWGAEVPAAPRNAVQHHVSRLRAALGADSIAAAPDGYALASATVDAVRFEELLTTARSAQRAGDAGQAAELVARALALWHGRPLQGLPDSRWAGAEAARLEALRIDALEEQFEAALALGDHAEVVDRIRRLLEEHPFRERLWGQLMLAQYRSGRQAEALESFRRARQVLAEQLGVEPGPGVQRLQAAHPGPRPRPGQRARGSGAAGPSAGAGQLLRGSPAGAGGGGRAGWAAPAGEPDRSAWGRQEPACAGGRRGRWRTTSPAGSGSSSLPAPRVPPTWPG